MYKILIDCKPLRVRFDKIDGCIKVCDGTRYLVLFLSENYKRIRYLVSVKRGFTYIISHNYPKFKVDLYNSLPLGKIKIFNYDTFS